jgi:hypothetical protein
MDIHPDTLVMVEWYSQKRKHWIPHRHHAIIVSYSQALKWYKQGVAMQCHTIDSQLLEELLYERKPKAY